MIGQVQQFLLDLLVDFRERDSSELVREAAKKAIELVGDFTLQIVEEGYEEAEGEGVQAASCFGWLELNILSIH